MKLRRWLWSAPLVAAAGMGVGITSWLEAQQPKPKSAEQPVVAKQGADTGEPQAAVRLPITQVVMFNSGVGYFARSGKVTGEARVDLTFPETDINDLLKSMTLQDFDGGRISTVSYDSREPVARTLSSFAINLNSQPSLSGILTQARGEKVEVVLQATATNQPGTLQGTVVGIEKQKMPVGTAQLDMEMLNLLTAEGLRCLKLMDVQRIRFLNPVLEAELKRALDTLALNHDTAKKSVSIQFSGEGERRVKVGYVIESPIWKTSYRLVLGKEGKPYLQGWAVVENPSDEDWTNVGMSLVSGRPISFKMDLYNPLYVPRPTVEPELFASLRPPAYEGGFGRGGDGIALAAPPVPPVPAPKPTPVSDGFGGGGPGGFAQNGDAKGSLREMDARRKQDKAFAAKLAEDLSAGFDPGGIASSATASKLGDFFQYIVDHPVTLYRQKSAMLPIVTKDVDADRVSIYNPNVQAKHPLLGLRFKNTTGQHLAQGPITVFEGNTYAGDSRILDIQPNDQRLLAYAIDLGTEVIPQNGPGSSRITKVKATKGIVSITRRLREERVYKISNRSDSDRTMLIEHPNRTNQEFKLVETAKPVEETKDLFRFETKVAAGKPVEFKVVEERDLGEQMILTNSNDDAIRFVISLNEASPALKKSLQEALGLKGKWDGVRRELQQVVSDIQRITQDQERIRRNLRETPKEAEVYTTYLKKLSAQEKEIDALTNRQKTLMTQEFEAKKQYETFLTSINE
jgi:hypothetical protein